MAEDVEQGDRTEEATPERREEFRERGQVVHSREISSVLVLAGCVVFLGYYAPTMIQHIYRMLTRDFDRISHFRIDSSNAVKFATDMWSDFLFLALPVFVVTAVLASASTLVQTRLNWSWKKLEPDFSRLNPLTGMKRMVSFDSVVELIKGLAKMSTIGFVAWLILKSEWAFVPGLMMSAIPDTWRHWGDITNSLFFSVSMVMVAIGGLDYFYNWITMERRMKMSKQELKEEYKRRELDPQVKGRQRRMARDIANRKTLENTKQATVLITNPTHYSVAVRYEIGMTTPMVVAKGIDFLALRMRETAKGQDIPIVENRPLARTLYRLVNEGQEIPEDLFTAVAEVIRYVFRLKGIRIPRKKTANKTEAPQPQI